MAARLFCMIFHILFLENAPNQGVDILKVFDKSRIKFVNSFCGKKEEKQLPGVFSRRGRRFFKSKIKPLSGFSESLYYPRH